jgi:hypothetical protein
MHFTNSIPPLAHRSLITSKLAAPDVHVEKVYWLADAAGQTNAFDHKTHPL